MIAQLRSLVKERGLKMFDERIMKDMLSFVRVDNQRIAEHAEGAYDDFVFALGIVSSSEVRSQGASYAEFEATPESGPVVSDITGY